MCILEETPAESHEGDPRVSTTPDLLARACLATGDLAGAQEALDRAQRIAAGRPEDNRALGARLLHTLGTIRYVQGDYGVAAHALEQALLIWSDLDRVRCRTRAYLLLEIDGPGWLGALARFGQDKAAPAGFSAVRREA